MAGFKHIYHHGEQELHGYLARPQSVTGLRPAVLVAHDWTGCNEFAKKKADMLARLGYIGFAVDMYGLGQLGDTVDERMALIQPFFNDRSLLRARITEAFRAVLALPDVDTSRVAAIGFCFGGMTVLDLARSGAELKAAISFHGLLNAPNELPRETICAKILVLHGYDDPMVNPDDVNAFCQEMTAANADWQVHQYGHTKHSFTNPDAHNLDMGTIYNKVAEQRSLQAMNNFLYEVFGE